MQRTTTELLDDLGDGIADRTITFGLDGEQFEIDLSQANVDRLRNLLSEFIVHGRTITQSKNGARRPKRGAVDAKAVRAWAREQGLEVPARGRVPREVADQYQAAIAS